MSTYLNVHTATVIRHHLDHDYQYVLKTPERVSLIVFRNDIQCSNICLEQDCAATFYEEESNICYLGVLVDKCTQVEGGIKVLTRNGKSQVYQNINESGLEVARDFECI